MVGPQRPQFILFGSSIVQLSFSNGGWGAHLSDIYSRKADILLRGYNSWNSRCALQVLNQVFPKDSPTQPDLVIVYFGGNDSMEPHPSGLSPHVPLPEYIKNMKTIASHLKSLSEKTRVIFLSCPPVNEEQCRLFFGNGGRRTNEACGRYSEACLELCKDIGVKGIDLWSIIQKRDEWKSLCFIDGVHLSSEGSKIVVDEILKVLMEAEWEPSLYWKELPTEFAEVAPYEVIDADGKIVNAADWTSYRENWQ
ncbi:GDSL esterase/lipase wdl1 [Ranunculus cassubicifolius]